MSGSEKHKQDTQNHNKTKQTSEVLLEQWNKEHTELVYVIIGIILLSNVGVRPIENSIDRKSVV
jgi:hypothetical protein